MLTLEQFRATRTLSTDLGDALEDESLEGTSGFLYVDALFIGRLYDGRLWLHIGNEQTTLTDTPDNLAALESILYDWACGEGYCDDDCATDDTRSNGPRA